MAEIGKIMKHMLSSMPKGAFYFLCGILCAASIVSSTLAATTSFTRSEELCPLRMSYAGVAELLQRLSAFVSAANENVPLEDTTHSLDLTGEGAEINLTGQIDLVALSQGPPSATKLNYTYRVSSLRNPRISGVSISLADSYRSLTVTGQDRQQVDALTLMLANELEGGCSIGGMPYRFALYVLLFMGGMYFLVYSLSRYRRPSGLVLIGANVGCIIAGIYALVAGESFLPGTYFSIGTSSWIDRNAALMTFFSLPISLAGLGLALVPLLRTRKVEATQQSSDDEDPV